MTTLEIIATAAAPLRAQAIISARASAQAWVDGISATLEAAGWDANVIAPYPSSAIGLSHSAYRSAVLLCQAVASITRTVKAGRPMHDPKIVEIDPVAVVKRLDDAEARVIASFDAYVLKLTRKIGYGVMSAALEYESGLWTRSILTVTRGSGDTERWRTTVITNYSVYGLAFNQWPTRKIKS